MTKILKIKKVPNHTQKYRYILKITHKYPKVPKSAKKCSKVHKRKGGQPGTRCPKKGPTQLETPMEYYKIKQISWYTIFKAGKEMSVSILG